MIHSSSVTRRTHSAVSPTNDNNRASLDNSEGSANSESPDISVKSVFDLIQNDDMADALRRRSERLAVGIVVIMGISLATTLLLAGAALPIFR